MAVQISIFQKFLFSPAYLEAKSAQKCSNLQYYIKWTIIRKSVDGKHYQVAEKIPVGNEGHPADLICVSSPHIKIFSIRTSRKFPLPATEKINECDVLQNAANYKIFH